MRCLGQKADSRLSHNCPLLLLCCDLCIQLQSHREASTLGLLQDCMQQVYRCLSLWAVLGVQSRSTTGLEQEGGDLLLLLGLLLGLHGCIMWCCIVCCLLRSGLGAAAVFELTVTASLFSFRLLVRGQAACVCSCAGLVWMHLHLQLLLLLLCIKGVQCLLVSIESLLPMFSP